MVKSVLSINNLLFYYSAKCVLFLGTIYKTHFSSLDAVFTVGIIAFVIKQEFKYDNIVTKDKEIKCIQIMHSLSYVDN